MKHLWLVLLLIVGCQSNKEWDIYMQAIHDLHYIEDSYDYWQTAKETDERGGGDCEDMAEYLYQLYIHNGYTARKVTGKMYSDSNTSHQWCEVIINGEWYIADVAGRVFARKDSLQPDRYIEKHSEYYDYQQRDLDKRHIANPFP